MASLAQRQVALLAVTKRRNGHECRTIRLVEAGRASSGCVRLLGPVAPSRRFGLPARRHHPPPANRGRRDLSHFVSNVPSVTQRACPSDIPYRCPMGHVAPTRRPPPIEVRSSAPRLPGCGTDPRRHPRSHEEFGASDDGVRGTCRPRTMRWSFYLTGLTLSNHERQVHVVRGRRAAERPPHPDLKPDNQSCQGEGAGGS